MVVTISLSEILVIVNKVCALRPLDSFEDPHGKGFEDRKSSIILPPWIRVKIVGCTAYGVQIRYNIPSVRCSQAVVSSSSNADIFS